MIVFDTTTIILFIDPKAKPPTDPNTGRLVEKCKERIEHLIDTLNKSKTRILIPTPVLSEFLVKAGDDKSKFLSEFVSSKNFLVGDFDSLAAIELAHLEDNDLKSNRKLDGLISKAKVKFDRQIVAIAKVKGAGTIYTDDGNLAKLARNNGIAPVMTWEIPLPPVEPQVALDLRSDPDD